MDPHRRKQIREAAQRRMLEELAAIDHERKDLEDRHSFGRGLGLREELGERCAVGPQVEELTAHYAEMLRPAGDIQVRVYEKPEWGVLWASQVANRLNRPIGRIRESMAEHGKCNGVHVLLASEPTDWKPAPRLSPHSRPVYRTLDGTTVDARFATISLAMLAMREEGACSGTAIKWALAKGTRAYGFYWRYADVPESQQPPLRPESAKEVRRPIFCTEDGHNRVREFESISQAAEQTKIPSTTLFQALMRGSLSSGFYWRYADVPESKQPPLRQPVERPVFSTTDGTRALRRFNSITDAARAMALSGRDTIHRALREGRRAGGVFWRYADVPVAEQPPLHVPDNRIRPVHSTDGVLVLRRFDSITQAGKAMDILPLKISKAIRNGHRVGGVFWRYADIPERVQTPLRTSQSSRRRQSVAA